jgi:hypothetical protein
MEIFLRRCRLITILQLAITHDRLSTQKPKSDLCYDRRSVGQCVLVSSPIWGPTSDFCYFRTFADFLLWGSISEERTGRLQILVVLASLVILGSESCGTHDHILLSQILDSPNLEGQVSIFISPRNWVTQLHSQAISIYTLPLPFTSFPIHFSEVILLFDALYILSKLKHCKLYRKWNNLAYNCLIYSRQKAYWTGSKSISWYDEKILIRKFCLDPEQFQQCLNIIPVLK